MAPNQFLIQLKKSGPAAGYAFLGNELFTRDGCRQALVAAALPEDQRQSGITQYDLAEDSLDALIEDARTLSLFSASRVIIGYNAEAAVPRTRDAGEDDDSAASPAGDSLQSYFRNPTPGVVILIEAVRFDWDDRDEKKKLERLGKFFVSVPVQVEMRRLAPHEALEGARRLAKQNGAPMADEILAELVEALGNDMARIANEIAKLGTYSRGKQEITREVLAALVPEARTSGLFEFTNALATRNRTRALEILDTLTRMDVYLPLQVSFLAGVFRYALAVKESGARTVWDVNRLFQKLGLPVWESRAQQVLDTAGRFSREQLEQAIVLLFEADRDLRRERPDDRIIMEKLVWSLTA